MKMMSWCASGDCKVCSVNLLKQFAINSRVPLKKLCSEFLPLNLMAEGFEYGYQMLRGKGQHKAGHE